MPTKININLKASGIIALLIIGAGIFAIGAVIPNEGVEKAGGILLGIGVFITKNSRGRRAGEENKELIMKPPFCAN